MLQEVHNFLQGILRFLLARHIRKGDAGLLVRHDFRIGLAEGERVHAAAHPLSELIAQQPAQSHEDRDRQDPAEQEAQQGIVLRRNLRTEADVGSLEPGNQPFIRKNGRLVQLLLPLIIPGHEDNLIRILGQAHLRHPAFIHPFQKITVSDHLDLPGQHHRKDKGIQQQNDRRHDHDIKYQRPSGLVVPVVFKHDCLPVPRFGFFPRKQI